MEYRAITPTGERLLCMYEALLEHFGPQGWWPAETPLEMMVGAVLTQNTNWGNVEKAIANLKRENLLDARRLHDMRPEALAERIQPAGYYRVKTQRLQNLVRFLMERYDGEVDRLLGEDTEGLRSGLLGVKGIGPETADSIVLYAASRPVFVVDAYTHRILLRHDLAEDRASYEDMQALFQDSLSEDVPLFQEFHALIVQTGKTYCRKTPRCEPCPLRNPDAPSHFT